MISLEHVTFAYPGSPHPVLRDVSLRVPEGELCLVVGRTGSGKSTLLRLVNGLAPWFTGGVLEGVVRVDGRTTAQHPPRELADLVGFVGQAPAAGFVAGVVEDELAYTMENLAVDPAVMRRRVEEVVDLLDLQSVRGRALRDLSAGEQQRVAIASVLAASPRVLLLDEPTSALDPGAAEEVLAAVTRLVHDLGLTVLMAEHRLERVVQYADRVVVVDGGRVTAGRPEEVMVTAPVAPPVVELGRLAGWRPLPLSVRDARRAAAGLRQRLRGPVPGPRGGAAPCGAGGSSGAESCPAEPPGAGGSSGATRPGGGGAPLAVVRGLVARYGRVTALAGVDLTVYPGEVLAVMGRNGAGKSTLLAHLAGLRAPAAGRVAVGGAEPSALPPRELVRRVALVPPDPGVLLYASTVAEECELADRDGGLAPGTTAAAVATVLEGVDPARHPRDLSEGQRLALALGVVLAPEPPLVLLDEPTRGLDYPAKRHLVVVLRRLADAGHGVVLATHDVELVAEVATRVVVLAGGEVVAEGPARDVVAASPMFAPQVAKVLAPAPFLTVAEVAQRLGVDGGGGRGCPAATGVGPGAGGRGR